MSDIYWLNDDSRKFLERGYLLPGETPEQRIIDIANKAQEYLGIEGWADKFIDYMHKGFYSLSDPQVLSILELKLQKLTALGINEIEVEIKKLAELIVKYKKIISSKKELLKVIKADKRLTPEFIANL